MSLFDDKSQELNRVIEESVPGKQVTIAHCIASPVTDIYERLGIDDMGAIGILTLSPYETAIMLPTSRPKLLMWRSDFSTDSQVQS